MQFKVEIENRQSRLDSEQIAVIKIRNGDVKPHGTYSRTQGEEQLIQDWVTQRKDLLARREIYDMLRTVGHLNLTAQ
jgi:hypothetical protein